MLTQEQPRIRGKRALAGSPLSPRPEQPRMCGERVYVAVETNDLVGNNPAYAGTTSSAAQVFPVPVGTTPHTRGKVLRAGLEQAD